MDVSGVAAIFTPDNEQRDKRLYVLPVNKQNPLEQTAASGVFGVFLGSRTRFLRFLRFLTFFMTNTFSF
ncbi:uncharacterized protein V6R79_009524 [Siganus canaliculatus]